MKQIEVMKTKTVLYLHTKWTYQGTWEDIADHEREGWAVRLLQPFGQST